MALLSLLIHLILAGEKKGLIKFFKNIFLERSVYNQIIIIWF